MGSDSLIPRPPSIEEEGSGNETKIQIASSHTLGTELID